MEETATKRRRGRSFRSSRKTRQLQEQAEEQYEARQDFPENTQYVRPMKRISMPLTKKFSEQDALKYATRYNNSSVKPHILSVTKSGFRLSEAMKGGPKAFATSTRADDIKLGYQFGNILVLCLKHSLPVSKSYDIYSFPTPEDVTRFTNILRGGPLNDIEGTVVPERRLTIHSLPSEQMSSAEGYRRLSAGESKISLRSATLPRRRSSVSLQRQSSIGQLRRASMTKQSMNALPVVRLLGENGYIERFSTEQLTKEPVSRVVYKNHEDLTYLTPNTARGIRIGDSGTHFMYATRTPRA